MVTVGISVSVTRETVSHEEFVRMFGADRAAPRAGDAVRADRVRFVTRPDLPPGKGHTVCPACLMYHNTEWLRSDLKKPVPPLHPKCYCELHPILDAALLRAGTRVNAREQTLPRAQAPGEFMDAQLRRLPLSTLQDVFGVGIGKLAKAGLVDSADLVTRARGIATLGELLTKLKISADDVRAMTPAQLAARYGG